MTATIEFHGEVRSDAPPVSKAGPTPYLRWRRDGESTFYEGRLIEKTDGNLAFITSYADRPDRTDLIQIELDADPSAGDHRLLVRCVEGHDETHCLVACTHA